MAKIIQISAIALVSLGLGVALGQFVPLRGNTDGSAVQTQQPVQTARSDDLAAQLQQMTRLEAELARAYEQIQALKNRPQTSEADITNLPVAKNQFPNIQQKLKHIPGFMLKSQLGYFFDEDALEGVDDPHQFTQRALEVALTNNDVDQDIVSASIEFSLSPIKGARLISQGAEVSQYDRVFAHISPIGTSSSVPGTVMVKWQNIDTGEVLLFRNQRMASNDERYVSFKPTKGWQQASYRVSVYNMNDDITPIGSNTYSINHVIAQEGGAKGPNQKVIEDLLLSGKATRKQ